MADTVAVLGMLILGGVGGVCAMLFLGFRRPSAHQQEVVRTFSAIQSEIQAIRRDLSA